MVVRCCLIYISTTLLLIDMVRLKVTVKNFVGESAILPCLYTEDKNQVDKVFWRHNDSKKVYEFSPGGSQEVKYDIRVESFYKEFDNGNYSIKIKNLETNDSGVYSCIITPADHFENMYLIIKAKEEPSQILIDENQTTQTIQWLIPVICFIIFSLFCILYILRKKRLCVFKPS